MYKNKMITLKEGNILEKDFKSGVSLLLVEKDVFTFVIKLSEVKPNDIIEIKNGDVSVALVSYGNKSYFTIELGEFKIEEPIDTDIVVADEKFVLESNIKDEEGYGFDFLLLNKDNRLCALRMIGVSTEFTKFIYDNLSHIGN